MSIENSNRKRNKFNAKTYLGKDRVYQFVPGAPRISKLYVWDEKKKEYVTPEFGKPYLAGKYVANCDGKFHRKYQFFETLDQARAWQLGVEGLSSTGAVESVESTEAPAGNPGNDKGPLFAEVVAKWKKKKFSTLAASTRVAYEKVVRLYFGSLLDAGLYEITSDRIDAWLDELKDPSGRFMRSSRRVNFKHELGVLSAVLRYYEDYHSDPQFHLPIKRRHWWDVKTGRKSVPKPKDLSEEEFLLFRKKLRNGLYGDVMAPLATLQYFEALRISEAAGIHFEDVRLNRLHPSKSRILIQRSVQYLRVKGSEAYVETGFKNSKQFPDGIKELPMFPQTFEELAPILSPGKRGLIFQIDGKPIGYRTIQYCYDMAFKAAGLPYTATHVLRHGWTREVFNQNPELDIAKQLLGDSSDEAARVYAKRRAGALTGVSMKLWNSHPQGPEPEPETSKMAETACNCLQKGESKKKPAGFLRVIK